MSFLCNVKFATLGRHWYCIDLACKSNVQHYGQSNEQANRDAGSHNASDEHKSTIICITLELQWSSNLRLVSR